MNHPRPPLVLEDVTNSVPPKAETNPTRFEGLEGYRAIAALLLVVFHAYQFTREGLGLESYAFEGTPLHSILISLQLSGVFFVLSGFLIFLPFARSAVEQRGERSVRHFFIRRTIRLLPPYYLAIILVWTWRYVGTSEQWTDLLLHLTFTQIFHPKYIFWTIGPAWALAVEICFYVFLALFGWLAYWLCQYIAYRMRLILLAGTALMLFILSVAFKAWAWLIAEIPRTNYPVYFGPLAKFDTLAVGMLLAIIVLVVQYRAILGIWTARGVRLLGFVVLISLIVSREHYALVNFYFHTLFSIGFVLILASTVLGPRGSTWERAMGWRPLQFIALISYSIYLWHEPIMIELAKHGVLIRPEPEAFFTNVAVLLTLSTTAGVLVYWLVQYPFNYLQYLFTHEGRLAQRYPDEGINRL